MTYEEVIKIKKQLKHSWRYFFRKFGKLLSVQVKAIPLILNKQNVILMSPTASGKTEAVMAPIAEKIYTENPKPPCTLYICPTHALVYDLYERLNPILTDMEITLATRTGERRQFSEKKPQEVILTTPESMDSMLCRNTDLLDHIKFVVLDELHLLHGNYRGDQLKLDLRRLEQISDDIQYSALSATFNDPEYIASQYFDETRVIVAGDARSIKYHLFSYEDYVELIQILKWCRRNKYRKILFFCNSRALTEIIASKIKEAGVWPSHKVFAHHGSLSRTERDAAEKALKREKAVICVATMTLEVGIDIGDIDIIGLVSPPPSVSSLLQRIGRGNRREDITRAIGIYSNDKEKEEFKLFFHKAELGEIEQLDKGPCLSVGVQQVFSYLYQRKFEGLYEEDLVSLLIQLPMKRDQAEFLIDKLRNDEYIVVHRNKLFPSRKLLDLGDKGFIHSNIPGGFELQVVDESSGKSIGNIERVESLNKDFMLSGKKWTVMGVDTDKVRVAPSDEKYADPAIFPGVKLHGRYYNFLPEKLKTICCKQVLI
ncbi:MAG: DEAD/DEAH box helicase [Elusimicrobiota bacterium]